MLYVLTVVSVLPSVLINADSMRTPGAKTSTRPPQFENYDTAEALAVFFIWGHRMGNHGGILFLSYRGNAVLGGACTDSARRRLAPWRVVVHIHVIVVSSDGYEHAFGNKSRDSSIQSFVAGGANGEID